MITIEILNSEYSDPWKALEVLEERDEEELTQEQKICLEFLRKHLKIKDKKTIEELRKEIGDINKFKDHHIDKIIEILPQSEEEVRALFSKERIKLEDNDIEKVIEICSSVKE